MKSEELPTYIRYCKIWQLFLTFPIKLLIIWTFHIIFIILLPQLEFYIYFIDYLTSYLENHHFWKMSWWRQYVNQPMLVLDAKITTTTQNLLNVNNNNLIHLLKNVYIFKENTTTYFELTYLSISYRNKYSLIWTQVTIVQHIEFIDNIILLMWSEPSQKHSCKSSSLIDNVWL